MTNAPRATARPNSPDQRTPDAVSAAEPVLREFDQMWTGLLPVGRTRRTGGYQRFAWSAADLECRAWFREQATARDLTVESDRNGNMWAWWGTPGPHAIVTGSHLDSVPDGGAFDGPLGVVTAFAAIDLLRVRGVTPDRPIAVVLFADEEGARFGVACVGSRLMTGALSADRARQLRDADGITLGEAMAAAGHDPSALGRDHERLEWIDAFVELHIEQGRALDDMDAAVGVASAVWSHGRWRLDLSGMANHAGTTSLPDRRDPMLSLAYAVQAARRFAERRGALATIGRVLVEPNGTNAIPSSVHAWLDARAGDDATVEKLVEEIHGAVVAAAADDGVRTDLARESWTPLTTFDGQLRQRVARVVAEAGAAGPLAPDDAAPPLAPVLATGAGHDAAILAAEAPTAMLFVRNPTGVSHSPAEHADMKDCLAGVTALAAVLGELACR